MSGFKSVKTVFVMAMLTAMILVFGIQTACNVYYYSNVMEDKVIELLIVQANSEAAKLNGDIIAIEKSVEELAGSIQALQKYDTKTITEIIKLSIAKEPLVYGSGFWLEPYAIDKNTKYFGPYVFKNQESGDIRSTWDFSDEDYNYFSREWYKAGFAENVRVAWSNPYRDELSHVAKLTASSPIKRNGRVVGVATVDIALSQLVDYINSIRIGKSGYAFLLSRDGKPFGSSFGESFSNIYEGSADSAQLKEIAGAVINEGHNGIIKAVLNERDVFVVFTPVGLTGIRLVLVIPTAEALSSIVHIFWINIATLLGAVVLFAFMLIRLFDKKIIFPLRSLGENAVLIGNGDLDRPLVARSSDEIGQLVFLFDQMRERIAGLLHEKQNTNRQLLESYELTIRGFYQALEGRESNTGEHSLKVNAISMEIGRRMGLSTESLRHLNWGTLLHDLGKLAIADNILLKPAPLTKEEFEIIKTHPEFGYKLLKGNAFLQETADIVLYHQEKYDGTGYPHGLKGEAIPLLARICTVADAFQAMVDNRPYRQGMTIEAALREIWSCRGTHFDPFIADILLSIFNYKADDDKRTA